MEECKHKFKTINTVSEKAYREGSKKFRSGFDQANDYGINILVARQQQCLKCGAKRTTVEISKDQLYSIFDKLPEELDDENTDTGLSKTELRVRDYLIRVSKGETETRHERKATYKEVWQEIYPSRPFGRGNTNEVVDWIVNISNFDTTNDRPPLNSLVVRGDTGMPGGSWEEWRKSSDTPYKTVDAAQGACWHYWK